MLTLYRFTGANCAAKVLLALSEKAIRFEDRLLTRADLSTDWYRALNPNGVVPTLVHDDEIVIESSVILMYLDDAFGGPRLSPQAPLARAGMHLWMKLAEDLLHCLGTISYAIHSRSNYIAKSPQERDAYYQSIDDYQIRESRRNAIELGVRAPEVPAAVRRLTMLQQRMDQALRSRDYLAGEYSLADISLTPFIFRLELLALLLSEGEAPHLHRWWRSIRARPSFSEAITAQMPSENVAAIRDAAARHAGELQSIRAKERRFS
jgi:glutathione S-transferase